MGLFARWKALPVKVRYYISGSTLVMALIGDYATTRVSEEARARREILQESSKHDRE